jgi:hypothetical protein
MMTYCRSLCLLHYLQMLCQQRLTVEHTSSLAELVCYGGTLTDYLQKMEKTKISTKSFVVIRCSQA